MVNKAWTGATINSMPSNPFIQAAREGQNALWRYVVTVIASSALLLAASAVVGLVAVGLLRGDPSRLPPAAGLVIALAPYPALILGLVIGMRWLHHRGMGTLVRPGGRFRWELLLISGGLWLAVSALGDAAMSLIFPGSYRFSFDARQYWPFALAAALLLPVQVAAEELWFRGYLTQGMGLAGGYWLGWIGPGLLFGMLHGFNPEVGAYGLLLTMPVYIGMGLLLGWVTLRTAGMEMALGLHLVNNLYATLLVGAPVSALPAPALFSVDQYHPEAALAVTAVGVVAYVAVVLWLKK